MRRGEAPKAPSVEREFEMWAEKKQKSGRTCDVERGGNKLVDRGGVGMQIVGGGVIFEQAGSFCWKSKNVFLRFRASQETDPSSTRG